METEIQELRSLRSTRISRNSEIGKDFETSDISQYTSLKDIMYNSPTKSSFCYEGNEFDSSNITIRNELVKRAASVYLQSAALLITKNHTSFEDFWEKLKSKAATLRSCWRVFAVNPVRACVWPIFRFLNNMLGNVRSLP